MNGSQLFFLFGCLFLRARLIVMQMARCPLPHSPHFAPLPLANNSRPRLAAAWQNSPAFLPLYISAMTFLIFRRATCTWPTNSRAKLHPIEI